MNRIILADDHSILRDGLKALLERNGFSVVAEASDYAAIFEQLKLYELDVIVCDCNMPGEGPAYLLNTVKRSHPGLEIVFLSGLESGLLFKQLMEMGVAGIVSKKDDVQEIVSAIRSIETGEQYLSPSVISEIKNAPDALSPKEYQVFELIIEGKTNNQIAEILHNSAGTINTHRVNIMKKFRVHTVVDLVKFAQRNGLVDIS